MAVTVTAAINDACARYRDLTRAQALLDIQAVHDELTEFCRLTDDAEDVALVSGVASYAFDASVLKIWRAELRSDDVSNRALEQISKRAPDQGLVAGSYCGTPRFVYRDGTLSGGREISLLPTPATTNPLVSGGTATAPVVLTILAHPFSTGDAIYLTGVSGLTGAQGPFPSITVIDINTISLDGSVGGGAYVSGGIVATATLPFLRLHVSRRQTLSEGAGAGLTTSLPESVFDGQAYVSGIWMRHARRRHQPDLQEHMGTFQQERAKLGRRITGVLADVKPRTEPHFRRRVGRH